MRTFSPSGDLSRELATVNVRDLSIQEFTMKDLPHLTASNSSLTDQLKRKSHRRRDDSMRMAKAVTPSALRNDLLPLLAVTYMPLSELQPAKRKLRHHDPAHVREVARAIGALGFCQPILVGRRNEIIDGEVRFEASRLLGLNTIPCVRIDHLSQDQQRVLRLAANRLAEKGQWDLDALKLEFEDLILTDAPIEITGFTLDEVDHIVLGDTAAEQGPLEPELDVVAVARVGDVFALWTATASYAATRLIP